MQFGDYRVEVVPDAEFRLDGGAMFGVVPRALWQRVAQPDEENRVRLNANCLYVEAAGERILIETGMGDKWSPRHAEMYGVRRERTLGESLQTITGCAPEDLTIVVNTHLHFDHAGGNTKLDDGGTRATSSRATSTSTPKVRTSATAQATCRRTGVRSKRVGSWN